MKNRTGIILALDIENEKEALSLIDNVSNDIDAIKLGYLFILNNGLEAIKKVQRTTDIPLILDLKISDIPFIASKIIKKASEVGFEAATICGFMGPEGCNDCIEAAKEMKIFIITEFTNPGGDIFTGSFSEDIAIMAKELGAYGIQAPGTRPEKIKQFRELIGDKMIIISCGIGQQGPEFGSAISAGADFEIIGRAIYTAKEPLKILKQAQKDIELARHKRSILCKKMPGQFLEHNNVLGAFP